MSTKCPRPRRVDVPGAAPNLTPHGPPPPPQAPADADGDWTSTRPARILSTIGEGVSRGPVSVCRYHRPEGTCDAGAHAVVLGTGPSRVAVWVPWAALPAAFGHRHVPVPLWPFCTTSGDAVTRALDALDAELGPLPNRGVPDHGAAPQTSEG